MKTFFSDLWSDESGQTMTEYALILAVIAVVVVVVMSTMGESISGKFEEVTETLDGESS